jgi:hypothetical protein
MDKNSDLENKIGIKMDKLDFDVVEQAKEEIASWEPESPLEERLRDYNFIGIGCRISSLLASRH